MSFTPFLYFQGQCAEAMRFYADLLGATDLEIMTYADHPQGDEAPASDKVLYSELSVNGSTLMACDYPETMTGDPQASVAVHWRLEDVDAARRFYDALRDGGEVVKAFGETFWSPGHGLVKDRFGTTWMVASPRKND